VPVVIERAVLKAFFRRAAGARNDGGEGEATPERRREFVRSLHRELLGRDVDAEALERRVRELAPLPAEEIFALFVRSEEYQRRRAQAVPLFVPPGHFYSPVTDPRELEGGASRIFDRDTPPAGVDLREAEQVRYAERMAGHYGSLEFGAETRAGLRYRYENPAFSYGDGIALACTILVHRPANIIEVGSGYSSAATLDVVERGLGWAARCLFIDPYTDRLEGLLRPGDRERVEIVQARVQDVGPSLYDRLGRGDLLFIDSTHVAKTGSDVVHHLTRVLPRLRPGVLVHFHDVFYPFEYPEQWAIAENRSWNELHCLHAFLHSNPDWEIVFFNDFMARAHRGLLERLMPLFLANPGGSLWLRKVR
jgi:predicted O-methyltransferase YrrM